MNKKIVSEIAVGVILIIAAAIGGIFWMQNQQLKKQAAVAPVENKLTVPIVQTQLAPVEESDNWQIYTNAEVGFQMKYPKEWSFGKDGAMFKSNYPKKCDTSVDLQDKNQKCLDEVSFVVHENDGTSTIKSFFDKQEWKDGQNYRDLKEHLIGNVVAYEVVMKNGFDGSESEELWVPLENGKYLSLGGYYLSDEEKATFEKMLKTFELIPVDNSNWQTYKSDKIGFEVQVPKRVASKDFRVVENGNVVWMAVDDGFYYQENAQKINGKGNEIERIKGISWAFLFRKINNDQELDKFIKDEYGKGCKFSGKELDPFSGLYNVNIEPIKAGGSYNESSCFLNWVIFFKYSAEKHMAILGNLGQDASFRSINQGVIYDQDILKSFKFTK